MRKDNFRPKVDQIGINTTLDLVSLNTFNACLLLSVRQTGQIIREKNLSVIRYVKALCVFLYWTVEWLKRLSPTFVHAKPAKGSS